MCICIGVIGHFTLLCSIRDVCSAEPFYSPGLHATSAEAHIQTTAGDSSAW